MKEFPDFKELDYVLSYIVNNTSSKILYSDVQKHFSKISKKELNEILLKIEKDGLILLKEVKIMDQMTDCVYSTFDGRLLSNSGGYTEQYKRDQQAIPLRRLKTELINLAALAAGVYYTFEIIRIYISPVFQHLCACQFIWQK
jgi:hypothetical protein